MSGGTSGGREGGREEGGREGGRDLNLCHLGASILARDDSGATPLHLATYW